MLNSEAQARKENRHLRSTSVLNISVDFDDSDTDMVSSEFKSEDIHVMLNSDAQARKDSRHLRSTSVLHKSVDFHDSDTDMVSSEFKSGDIHVLKEDELDDENRLGSTIVYDTDTISNQFNLYTVLVCIVACSGALLFGLDVGITGGVTAQPAFLQEFFPEIYLQLEDHVVDNKYCSFDSALLAFFTSCFFLAGIVGSIVASYVTAHYGRKASMNTGALLYLMGSILNAGAVNHYMLIVGRLCLGFGCGFINQSVPMFLSEIPPPSIRGSLQVLFQCFVAFGIFIAALVNYGTEKLGDYGWRISLGVFIPISLFMLVAGLYIPETPTGLAIQGKVDEAHEVLIKLRTTKTSKNTSTTNNVAIEREFLDIKADADRIRNINVGLQWKTFLSKPYRGELTVAIVVAFCSQMTGINAILYFTPQLFASLGSGSSMALISAIIVNGTFLVAGIASIFLVDRVGRKPLLVGGAVAMAIFQIAICIVLALKFDPYGNDGLEDVYVYLVLVLLCLFTFSFGLTWGPLGWCVPVEIQSLETRSAGATTSVIFNFFAAFVTTQSFLPMLCKMTWGIFVFFAAFDVGMAIFSVILLPETKGVPIPHLRKLFQNHWFWTNLASDTKEERELIRIEEEQTRRMNATSNTSPKEDKELAF